MATTVQAISPRIGGLLVAVVQASSGNEAPGIGL